MFRSVNPLPPVFRKNRLAFYRVTKGVKQHELARELGVTTSAISNWERDAALPQKKHAHQVASILQVPVRKLWPDEPFLA